MSMILQNTTTTTTAATAKTPGAASAAGTTGATGAGFNQALTYVMGSAGTAGTAANVTTAGQVSAGIIGSAASLLEMLQQVISGEQDNTGGTQGEQVEKVGKLMEDLLGKLEDMDASIVNDPALMQSLQAWLVQVQQVLSGDGESQQQGTEGGEPVVTGQQTAQQPLTAALPAIAQQPETLRFAVADAVSQVVDKLQTVQSGSQQADPKLEQLLNNLQNVLQQSGESTMGQSGSGQGGNQQQQSNNPFQTIAVQDTTAAASTTIAQTENTAESVEPVTSQTQHQEPIIVTAGQLAMKADAAPLTTTAPPPTMNAQNFSQEMGKFIVSKFDVQQLNGVSEAKIILNPEHLGQVDVKITIQDGQLMAQFITEKHGAKDMLEQQMAQLRSALQAQGLQVEKLEVTQSSSMQSDMYNGGQGFQSGSDQQQSGRRSKSKEEQNGDAVLAAELGNELNEWREERVNMRGANRTPYGSTYVAKA
ncbi:flagellar hook-length control protein FliK [Paenibacillus dauci]|uniref:flagellar hook-length control protein FliK n=1 Tax=Paenibacillus dauci TaxID=1567106 RepID=UPI0006190D6C|nr:flagellar hook-length control protein FliK [Paenibacillus dauci]